MPECCSVIDVHGLHALATLSDNLRMVVLTKLQSGELGVPAVVWQEFEELYEDEAAALVPHVSKKISLAKKYVVGAASIADQLGKGFPDGAYNRNADLYTASIAVTEDYTVVTVLGRTQMYESMGCTAIDAATLAML